jgi:crossover junction endodeoxyribonuclease RusA
MKITLPYPPSSNRYWRWVKTHFTRSAEAKKYIEYVGWEFQSRDLHPVQGEISVTMHLFRPAKRGDLDNRIKIVLDAMQGFAYINDNQIREIHAVLHDDKAHPRLEVEVLSYAG